MSDEPTRGETCVVCGKSTDGNTGTAHLFHDGRSFALCCPVCVEMFQRAPARFASGEKRESLVEELLAEMKWKNPSQE